MGPTSRCARGHLADRLRATVTGAPLQPQDERGRPGPAAHTADRALTISSRLLRARARAARPAARRPSGRRTSPAGSAMPVRIASMMTQLSAMWPTMTSTVTSAKTACRRRSDHRAARRSHPPSRRPLSRVGAGKRGTPDPRGRSAGADPASGACPSPAPRGAGPVRVASRSCDGRACGARSQQRSREKCPLWPKTWRWRSVLAGGPRPRTGVRRPRRRDVCPRALVGVRP